MGKNKQNNQTIIKIQDKYFITKDGLFFIIPHSKWPNLLTIDCNFVDLNKSIEIGIKIII